MCRAHDILRHLKLNNGSSRKIPMVITFHSDVRFSLIIYWDARNWTWKASTNSNGHNFLLECMCEAYDISRRSKINHEDCLEIQMVITFSLDVRFKRIIYRDTRNWTRKPSADSNGHNFWLVCMCEAHDISRRSKMKNGDSLEIQMVITFHLDLRFTRIIYRDTRNWTWKLSGYSKSHNFWLVCMCEAHDISRPSKLNNGGSRDIQMVITFDSFVCVRPMIYRDARK